MNFKQLVFLVLSCSMLMTVSAQVESITSNKISKKWTNLFEGNPQENWEIFIGAPHAAVKGLDNIDPKSDGKNSKTSRVK